MTNEVQKIREELVRLKGETSIGLSEHENGVEQGRMEIINALFLFLDSMQQEPVSEGLEEAGKEWLKPQLDKSYANYGETKMMELTHFDGYAMLDAIEFGAKWQKEQLMAKAVDGEVGYWNLRGLSINTDLPRSVSEGDKVKIIVIKED